MARKVTERSPRRGGHNTGVYTCHWYIREMPICNEPCLVPPIMFDIKYKVNSYLLVSYWWGHLACNSLVLEGLVLITKLVHLGRDSAIPPWLPFRKSNFVASL